MDHETLRADMVEGIEHALGRPLEGRVLDALSTVPRHEFLAEPYANRDREVAGPRALRPQTVARLVAALERGVDVSLLVERDLFERLPEGANRAYYERLSAYENYSARYSADVSTTFELIDDTEVCIEVPHPLGQDETFGVVDLKDPAFTADVSEAFADHWADATPVGPP